MKSVKKQYVFGFLLVFLIGVGLLIGGIVHYKQKWDDMVETQGYILSVQTRIIDDAIEYRPSVVRFFVDGKAYQTSVSVWFNYPLIPGDTLTVWYNKNNPNFTIVSNTNKETMSFAFMICGGVLIIAGIALTVKYLYDCKKRKKV